MKDNTIRGKLLEFLKEIYPEGTEERTIIGVFYPYHKYNTLVQALEYLVDKGYVSRKDVPHPYKKQDCISIYKLAPSGVDLLDGNIADPGVTILPEEG